MIYLYNLSAYGARLTDSWALSISKQKIEQMDVMSLNLVYEEKGYNPKSLEFELVFDNPDRDTRELNVSSFIADLYETGEVQKGQYSYRGQFEASANRKKERIFLTVKGLVVQEGEENYLTVNGNKTIVLLGTQPVPITVSFTSAQTLTINGQEIKTTGACSIMSDGRILTSSGENGSILVTKMEKFPVLKNGENNISITSSSNPVTIKYRLRPL